MGGLENMDLPQQEFQYGGTREYGDIPRECFLTEQNLGQN
jgi:hypothetical protein